MHRLATILATTGIVAISIGIFAQETRPKRNQAIDSQEDKVQDHSTTEKRKDKKVNRPRPGDERYAMYGVRVGEKLPSVSVYSIEGKKFSLEEITNNKPTLFVTASLTCPVARRQCPKLQSLMDDFRDELNIVIVYTIEAHPKGSPSPYRPGEEEWLTSANEREELFKPQPKSLDERLELAREFHESIDELGTVIVDGMENEAWDTLGGGPNMGLFVDSDGVVRIKHSWLRPKTMKKSIVQSLRGETVTKETPASQPQDEDND